MLSLPIWTILLTVLLAPPALAQRIDLPRPGQREFILHRASLISAADREKTCSAYGWGSSRCR